jgi:hypothetical protein
LSNFTETAETIFFREIPSAYRESFGLTDAPKHAQQNRIGSNEALRPTSMGMGTIEGALAEFVIGDQCKAPSPAFASNPQEKREDLYKSKEKLLSKKYVAGIELSAAERRNLAYILWQIGRIEESRLAEDLSALGKVTHLHEQLAAKVQTLLNSVHSVQTSTRYPR